MLFYFCTVCNNSVVVLLGMHVLEKLTIYTIDHGLVTLPINKIKIIGSGNTQELIEETLMDNPAIESLVVNTLNDPKVIVTVNHLNNRITVGNLHDASSNKNGKFIFK